jgi:CubicO group peptidase (beta-lactamase class C family)
MKHSFIFVIAAFLCGCTEHPDPSTGDRNKRVTDFLDKSMRADHFPGIQYIVTDSSGIIFEYFGGYADIGNNIPMSPSTTMMAYSMTKTFTAAAVLQLIEQGKLFLDDSVFKYFPATPYGNSMTIRHLLSQTSGIPNPIPLRWAHLAGEHASFDENRELEKVLQEYPEPEFPPGSKYAYSNISYWILGKIIEQVSRQSYPDYMRDHIFTPLGLSASDAGFIIPDASKHAKGYLKKYSLMNLIKGFLIDDKFIGEYESNWLHINDHHLNGPGFGGLVITARGVAAFLRDQLKDSSVLMDKKTHELFFTRQKTTSGEFIDMTPGWHIGKLNETEYYFKEGGGGGYHAEMRIYPEQRIATVVIVNETSSDCTELQSETDLEFVLTDRIR